MTLALIGLACAVLGFLMACLLFWLSGHSVYRMIWPDSPRGLRRLAGAYARLLRRRQWPQREFGISRMVELHRYLRKRLGSDLSDDTQAFFESKLRRACDREKHPKVRVIAEKAVREIAGSVSETGEKEVVNG